MRKQLKERILMLVKGMMLRNYSLDEYCLTMSRKKQLIKERNAEIVKVTATGTIEKIQNYVEQKKRKVFYIVHFCYLIKQRNILYIEEEIMQRCALFNNGVIVNDFALNNYNKGNEKIVIDEESLLTGMKKRRDYYYDRLRAVQYAERWWNDYNPVYRKFDVDCTNYVSQCLHAGGAPMWGKPNREQGWWMVSNNWSFSWTVAHALRWYLATSTTGLRAREVSSPEELLLGDVICYDFQGDGRYDHTALVTGKDALGMPLVNAHTYNSRQRYWSYEDSSAYTSKIKYKFFTIIDKN